VKSNTHPLAQIVFPRRTKVSPSEYPDLPYIGLENIEAHTTRLLGTVPATDMRSAANRFQPGDVLYSRLRPYLNKVWRADREGLCSAEFIVLPGNEHVDSDFLRYRLNSRDFVSFANSLNAGDRPRVDFDQISPFQTWLPRTLPEQRRIVTEIEKQFTRLDAGVAALRRVQANLKRYRAAVLKAACEGRIVLTEAELAKAGKRKSKFETGEALLARVLTERRQNWQGRGPYKEPAAPNTVGLPPIPEGWTWARAEQLCGFITKGTTPSAENMRSGEGEIPFIKVYNLTFTGALNSGYKPVFISRKLHEVDLARSEVRAGDILINIVGPPLGQVSIVPAAIKEANINQAVARFRVVLPESRKLLGIWLMAEPIISWAMQRAKTTAGQSNLTLEHCRDLPIPLPPLAEQTRIVAEVERRLSVIEELEAMVSANLQRAIRLRQSILQKAFTGALVPGTETNQS